MEISLELVPRSLPDLETELKLAQTHLKKITAINIPDLLRFDLRSWQGCTLAKNYYPRSIPHIRAIDYNLAKPLPFAKELEENHIHEVLVVSGDPPVDMSKRVYPSSVLNLIHKIKRELPFIGKVYAALDPYRSAFHEELAYVKHKLEAGADGIFSQPFFDMRLLDMYMEQLEGLNVYWGITSVTSKSSMRYWQVRNHAIFPKDFDASLEWNREFAAKVLEYAQKHQQNLYFMPIRTDLVAYLGGLL
ncbi:MAG: methylenetetrahydrofolate reductase [Deinococcales bacterium]